MFVLDGQVCPQLLAFKSKLKTTPSALTKSWSNLNDFLLKFKRCFIVKQINTRQKLFDEWEKNPSCKFYGNFYYIYFLVLINFLSFVYFTVLLHEYQNILYDVSLSELMPIWPPMKLE